MKNAHSIGCATLFALGVAFQVDALGDYLPRDLPPGWSSFLGSLAQVGAVYLAAHIGFQAQANQHKLAIAQLAKSVAAPLRVELLHNRAKIVAAISENELRREGCLNLPPPKKGEGYVLWPFRLLDGLERELYESQLPRIGDIGGFAAYFITTVYKSFFTCNLAEEPHPQVRDGYMTFPPHKAGSGGEKVISGHKNILSKVDEAILLLTAIEETGNTGKDFLETVIKANRTS